MGKNKFGASFDKQEELLNFLKSDCPEIFSEGNIDCKKLKQTLGEKVDENNEHYGLSWAGKSNCFREIQKGTTATLKPSKEESVDFDKTGNLFIEGDNLEVLKVLQRSYYGKVKCIYIDPPYNTGNDFIYKDNFRKTKKQEMTESGDLDEEGDLTRADGLSVNRKDSNGHFHSDWLNMLYPRLFLARNLLQQDGVIFVSIDDNEVHNLRMIMNEIFGEENFVGMFIKQSKVGGGSDTKFIVQEHEYCLVYSKTKDLLNEFFIKHDEDYLKRYKDVDEKGRYFWDTLARRGLKNPIRYEVVAPDGTKLTDDWNRSVERFKKDLEEGDIKFVKTKSGNWNVYFKQRLNEKGKKPRSLTSQLGGTIEGKQEINKLLEDDKVFLYPKSVRYVKFLVEVVSQGDDLILDFFAGSGTTAQAVMEKNVEDGGNRKWICVQLPEICDENSEAFKAGYKNIAEIAKERIRRAGKKIKEEKESVDVGFKALKLDKSNFKIWQGKFENEESLLTALADFADNLEKGSVKENILYELLLKSGLDLNVPMEEKEVEGEKYFDLDGGKLFIYLDENISIEMAKKFIEMRPEKIICLERAFKNNDELKTNILLQAEQEDVDFRVL